MAGALFLLLLMLTDASGAVAFVGVSLGTNTTSLPAAAEVVAVLTARNIGHLRLFDADHQMLAALAGTGIEVMVGVPNDQLLRVGQSRAQAADWISRNVAAFVPQTKITYVAVGDEVLTALPNAAAVLVPAMRFLQAALLAANLDDQVKVSSPQSIDLIATPFPPSAATFNNTSSTPSIVPQMLRFLQDTGSAFLLNADAYDGYVKANGVFPIEYALFRPLNPDDQIADPNTNLVYTSMFDAMVDAAYNAMQASNFTDIQVAVTSTGWPWRGGRNEPAANVDNALAYNTNLIQRVLNGSGTPGRPDSPISAYIFELFDEDLQPGPVSDRHRGITFPNGTDIYALTFEGRPSSAESAPLVGVFCVANTSASPALLKQSLDWACGPGLANCTAVQPGGPCYQPDDVAAVASYVFNDYYHRAAASGGTCSFGGAAVLTSANPSNGSCVFAGSLGANSTSARTPLGATQLANACGRPRIHWLSVLAVAVCAAYACRR